MRASTLALHHPVACRPLARGGAGLEAQAPPRPGGGGASLRRADRSGTRRGNRLVLADDGDQALEGTKQAQFHLDASGTVQEITISWPSLSTPIPSRVPTANQRQKTFVEDTFQKVWVYPSQGVTVYWAKDGTGAEALTFAPSKAAAKPGTEAPKAAGEASKAAAAPPQSE